MIGAQTPGHPFRGNFACLKCTDRYRALSRKKLQLMIENNEELTTDQLRLHEKWEAGRAYHAAYVAKMEQQNMESNPEETMAANRLKTRRDNIKRKNRAPIKSKKKSGFDRRNHSPKLHYNPRFTKMLQLMVDTLIDTVGLPFVSSFLLNSVYTELVKEELKADRSVGFKMGYRGPNRVPVIAAIEYDKILYEKFEAKESSQQKFYNIKKQFLPSEEYRLQKEKERSHKTEGDYIKIVAGEVYRKIMQVLPRLLQVCATF